MKVAPSMGALESASGRRVPLHWPLLRRSHSSCNLCKDYIPGKREVSQATINDRLILDLKTLPRVAPLPPPSVLPCDRASPSKYVVSYSIALIVEGTSLIFMLGRVVWLGSGVKRERRILQALRTQ